VIGTDGVLFRFWPNDAWRSCALSGETRYERKISDLNERYAGAAYVGTIDASDVKTLFALALQLPLSDGPPALPCPPHETPTEVSLVSERTQTSATFRVIGRYRCGPTGDSELQRRFTEVSARVFFGPTARGVAAP
jgi:hypothetical protein